jgi:hypothetical protein
VLAIVCASATVHADDDPATRGEELAKSGDYSRAIDAFKAADKQHATARNACMIALAYLRRELWPQAEVFMSTCKERASAADPVPDWFGEAEQQLVQKLAAANVAPVTVIVEPDVATVTITESSFAPDEAFAPRTVHLAPGRHTLELRAPGYEPETRTVDIADKTPQRVAVHMYRAGMRPTGRTSRVPWYVIGAGVTLGAATAIYSLAVVNPLYNELQSTHDMAVYNRDKSSYAVDRDVALGIGGAAVATIVVGIVLRYTVYTPETVHVAASVERGGGTVTLSFDRW